MGVIALGELTKEEAMFQAQERTPLGLFLIQAELAMLEELTRDMLQGRKEASRQASKGRLASKRKGKRGSRRR